MTKSEAQELLHIAALPYFLSHGFHAAEKLFYVRNQGDVSATIGLGGKLLPDGAFDFGYVAGVRFSSLETLLSDREAPPTKPTLFVPHHFFETGHAFYSWSFSNPTELSQQVLAMQQHVARYAVPFWSGLTSVSELLLNLDDAGFRANLPLDPIQMICLRAAVLAEMRQRNVAVQLLQKSVEERANELPKKRRDLERLLARLKQPEEG